MRSLLLAVLSLALLAPGAWSVPTSPDEAGTPVVLNGFAFTLPDGYAVSEGANGQAAYVDVREEGSIGFTAPLVRLVVLPGTAIAPDDVMHGMLQELGSGLTLRDSVPLADTPPVRVIDGGERTGLACEWKHLGETTLRGEAFAFVHGDHLVGLLLAIPHTAFGILEDVADGLLASLEVRTFDFDGSRREALQGFAFDVPTMLATERRPTVAGDVLVFSWYGGQLEATVRAPGFKSPYERAEAELEKLAEQYAEGASNEGGELADARPFARWLGDGIVPGVTARFATKQRAFDLRAVAVPGETGVLLLTLAIGDPDLSDVSLDRLDGVLRSLAFRSAVRERSTAAAGLVLTCDPTIGVESTSHDHGERLELVLPWTDDSGPRLSIDLRTDLDPAVPGAGLAARMADVAQAIDLDAGLGAPEAVSGRFLGIEEGLGMACTLDGVPHEVYAFAAPLGARVAMATLVTRADDASDALWIFANLLARIAPVSAEPRDG
ncbi:MAG: hypothetical protein H6825_07945 [Planctomycetes bacterium]|nr:hypothetical protein [Planctomycetota bacterium]